MSENGYIRGIGEGAAPFLSGSPRPDSKTAKSDSDKAATKGVPEEESRLYGKFKDSSSKNRQDSKKPFYNLSTISLDEEAEWNFVLKSWKRVLRQECSDEPAWTFFPRLHASIERVRDREGSVFVCARSVDDPDQIFGFAVLEGPAVHFVFVKKWFRRRGIAERLLTFRNEEDERFATAWVDSPAVAALAKKLNVKRIDL